MKHPLLPLSLAAFAVQMCLPVPLAAQQHTSLHHIKAIRPAQQITLLDSVVSDNYRRMYQYNEYGYITSVMDYNLEDGQWKLDAEDSYLQDYRFDASGQCVERVRYSVDANGNRASVYDKGMLEVKDGLTWERIYSHYDDGNVYPSTAVAYDKWGNRCIEIEYGCDHDWQTDKYTSYIYRYEENRYTGPVWRYGYNHVDAEQAMRTYHLVASGQYGTEKPHVVDSMHVTDFEEVKWESEQGHLYRRTYRPQSGEYKVCDLSGNLECLDEAIYTLDASGQRPLTAPGRTMEWDSKGRLVKEVWKMPDSTRVTRTYTYADDYAATLTLEEAIARVEYNVLMFPEDDYQQFGRIATYLYEYHEPDYDGVEVVFHDSKESGTLIWDADGRLLRSTWIETDEDSSISHGEITYGYNDAGHMAYSVDNVSDNGDNYSVREDYIYDSDGKWVDVKETEDGDGEVTRAGKAMHRHALQKPRKAAPDFSDMTDGSHDINENDGVWQTRGYYYVADGVIRDGYYRQYLVSTSGLPSDPRYNYTDPQVPLDSEDEWDTPLEALIPWQFRWDEQNATWKCELAPGSASRNYRDGNRIIRDTYNAQQQLDHTTVYTLDDEGRWVTTELNGQLIERYEYLEGTDYLLRVTYYNVGTEAHVCRYFYSEHSYVPTGVEHPAATESQSQGHVYDLQGRRVQTPSHGIYIINGRKVLR